MSRYTKEHYEDVARLLRAHHLEGNDCDVQDVVRAFADLFATDNLPFCRTCGIFHSAFHASEGLHDYGGGFDRDQFLTACGLEGEN